MPILNNASDQLKEKDLITSESSTPAEILAAVKVLTEPAVSFASVYDLEEGEAPIKKFRDTIEYIIDFHGLHSEHFNIKKALLADFDEAIAEQYKDLGSSEDNPSEKAEVVETVSETTTDDVQGTEEKEVTE